MSDLSASPEQHLDLVFQALANQTRRALVRMLAAGPARITDLARPFGVSLNAISKHVLVLERAGLVVRSIEGREHFCALQAGPMASAEQWLSEYETFWTGTLDRFAAYVEVDPDDPGKKDQK